jgi:hypothetical protein
MILLASRYSSLPIETSSYVPISANTGAGFPTTLGTVAGLIESQGITYQTYNSWPDKSILTSGLQGGIPVKVFGINANLLLDIPFSHADKTLSTIFKDPLQILVGSDTTNIANNGFTKLSIQQLLGVYSHSATMLVTNQWPSFG